MPPQDQLHHFPARIIGPEHIYPIRSPIISCSCFIGFNAVSSTTLILLPSVRLICRRPHQPQVPLTSKSWSSMASCKSTSQETSSSSTLARTLFTTSFSLLPWLSFHSSGKNACTNRGLIYLGSYFPDSKALLNIAELLFLKFSSKPSVICNRRS